MSAEAPFTLQSLRESIVSNATLTVVEEYDTVNSEGQVGMKGSDYNFRVAPEDPIYNLKELHQRGDLILPDYPRAGTVLQGEVRKNKLRPELLTFTRRLDLSTHTMTSNFNPAPSFEDYDGSLAQEKTIFAQEFAIAGLVSVLLYPSVELAFEHSAVKSASRDDPFEVTNPSILATLNRANPSRRRLLFARR